MKFLLKFFTLLGTVLGFFLPIILGIIGGFDQKSFSEYYFTEAKFAFVFCLTIISFSFITFSTKWSVPAIFLIILTYFNSHDYRIIHNVSAYIFFLSSVVLMIRDKRYSYLGYLVIGFTPLVFHSIYYFELISVLLISIFHFLYTKLLLTKKIL